jgi:hypothetical protein
MLSPAPPNLNWTSAIDAAKIQKILIDNQKVEKKLVLKNSNGGGTNMCKYEKSVFGKKERIIFVFFVFLDVKIITFASCIKPFKS